MGLLLNRAKAATATTGTGTVTLGTAVVPYQSWSAAGAVNNRRYSYLIEDGNDWEIGVGVYASAGGTLTRSLTASSTGALLNLSGSATVACVMRAEDRRFLAIKNYTGLANSADTINVNNTGYVDCGAMSFAIDLDEFRFNDFRLVFSAGSNQAGQSVTAQLTYQFSPTSPIHTGGNDIQINNSFGTYDSGWRSKDDAITTGMVVYGIGLKGSNSTVDLAINSLTVLLRE